MTDKTDPITVVVIPPAPNLLRDLYLKDKKPERVWTHADGGDGQRWVPVDY